MIADVFSCLVAIVMEHANEVMVTANQIPGKWVRLEVKEVKIAECNLDDTACWENKKCMKVRFTQSVLRFENDYFNDLFHDI